MAIKGKRKPQGRGSARRRPAAAPRPLAPAPRRQPWYRTTAGQSLAGIAALLIALLAFWAISDARSEAEARAARQDQLEDFTTRLRSALETLRPPVTEMARRATAVRPRDVTAWNRKLAEAQTQVAGAVSPPGLEVASRLLAQAVGLYSAAAESKGLLGEVEGDVRRQVAAQSGALIANADALWSSAIELLDEARADAELRSSGLEAPGAAATRGAPGATSAPIQVPEGGGNG